MHKAIKKIQLEAKKRSRINAAPVNVARDAAAGRDKSSSDVTALATSSVRDQQAFCSPVLK